MISQCLGLVIQCRVYCGNIILKFKFWNRWFNSWLWVHDEGADERFGDGVGGRRRLLSGEWCNRVCRERGECTSFDPSTCSDDTAKRAWYEGPLRDPLRARIHLKLHAGGYFFLRLLPFFRTNEIFSYPYLYIFPEISRLSNAKLTSGIAVVLTVVRVMIAMYRK